MPNVERMISLKDALDHIEQVVLAKHIAIKRLYEALVDERVVAVSEHFVRTSFYEDGRKEEDPVRVTLIGLDWKALVRDEPGMPPSLIEWFHNQWFYYEKLHNSYEGITFIKYEVTEIKVYERQIKTIWPHHGNKGNKGNKTALSGARCTAQGEVCRDAFENLYPTGIPGRKDLTNKRLVGAVTNYIEEAGHLKVSPDTILRAAGRKQ